MPLRSHQCCQGAEISAAKHKGAEKNCAGPGESEAELMADLSKKKEPKGSRIFLQFVFTLKWSYFWWKIVTSH
jgi:hypothetical protein